MSKKLSSHKAKWAPQEISALRSMSEMGMSAKEIGHLLGRTPNAVAFQKSVHGIVQNKEAKFTGLRTMIEPSTGVKTSPTPPAPEPKNPMRNPAKEITRIARQIARENGKRITMAMFFVEDLV
jgi:hypothetical protein